MKPIRVAVREATTGDAEPVLRSYAWLFAEPGRIPRRWDEGLGKERILRAISSPDSTILIATAEDQIVGICSVYLDIESVRYGRRAWVEDLAVIPTMRSQGIGKVLLDTAKDWARARGASHLKLDSGIARTDAHRFYERERPTAESRCYGWDLDGT